MSQPCLPQQARRTGAFTLVELAVAVAVIGILAALAIPYFKRTLDRSRMSTLENDLRIYEQDFDTYELKNGFYPASQPTAGVNPVGMEGQMSRAWILPSPVGGTYRWVYSTEEKPEDRIAYIEIIGSPEHPIILDTRQLAKIDDELDDGNISSGRMVLYGTNIRYYLRQ
ncbi:type II secretion system protein [Coraliomargarita parva]|uniref:type II secretion system protein n=1 Tax=Coraliomargarita parva TaxID=3014050 RepID=UPI0022B45CA7|nr:prepilin-type N-terminal cleavage/methylation domain-containing protein [Coraliomargarita parva]